MAVKIFHTLLFKFYDAINNLMIRIIKYKIKRLENKINRLQKLVTGSYKIISKLYKKLSPPVVKEQNESELEQVEKSLLHESKDKTRDFDSKATMKSKETN